jgi:hypothetical protein
MRVHEVHPVTDHRGVDLISDALPFGRLWYSEPNAGSNAVDYAKFDSRSQNAVIRVYDDAGNVMETHEQAGAVSQSHKRFGCHVAFFAGEVWASIHLLWFDDDTRSIGARESTISGKVADHGEVTLRVSCRDTRAIWIDFVLGHPVLGVRK